MQRFKLQIKILLLAAGVVFLAGCATDQDTDLPWNSPQPWEGSPTMPGMPNYR